MDLSTHPAPCLVPSEIGFSPAVSHRRIGSGWMSWSHGYTGDVYYTNGASSITLTMPAGTVAVYFYVQPSPFAEHTFQVLVNETHLSEQFTAHGSAGAVGFGVCANPLHTVVVSCTSGADFAIGEFGITCLDMLGACCDEANGTCTEHVWGSECQGLRFAAFATCEELDPPCGQMRGACCYGEECAYERPSECGGEYQGDGVPCDPNPCLCADFFVYPEGDPPLVLSGTTCGMGDDCALRVGEDVSFAVHIRWPGLWTFSLCDSTLNTYWNIGHECCTAYWSEDDSPECGTAGYLLNYFEPGVYYIDLEPSSPGACGNYVLTISGPREPAPGACCDELTSLCTDGLSPSECFGEHMRHDPGGTCSELSPVCGNPGACCDLHTGLCLDDVLAAACRSLDRLPFSGLQCDALEPACGDPGCCCEPPEPGEIEGPHPSLRANCVGRFISLAEGEPCTADIFTPYCGSWGPSGALYCPSDPDNPAFRAGLSALLGQPVDFFNAYQRHAVR